MPRGQKSCPQCGVASGPRTKICGGCGHAFVIKGRTTPASVSTEPSTPSGPPVHVPKAKREARACSIHPRYTGEHSPKAECEACWRMYLRDRFDDRVKPLDEALVVTANDPEELHRFIQEIRSAQERNAQSGGGYAAFFHTKEGHVIQFNIQVPAVRKA